MLRWFESRHLRSDCYESTYIREIRKANKSLAILQIILPCINLFDDNDIDYMMSRKGRYTWYDNLKKHPIRLKSGDFESIGFTTSKETSNFKMIGTKAKSVIYRAIPNSIKEFIRGKKWNYISVTDISTGNVCLM